MRRALTARELLERVLVLSGAWLTAGVFGIAFWVDRFGRGVPALDARGGAIVVLGAKALPGGVASPALRARAETGASLYHSGAAPLVLVTGGFEPSEASVAARILREQGVPAKALILEEQSRNTRENAELSAPLLKARGISKVVLVSDPFHLLRGCRLFEKQGIRCLPFPASLEGRGYGFWERLFWTAREAFALLLQPGLFLRGAR